MRTLVIAGGLALTSALMAVHIWYYTFLCDDAYIAFRYARNLARGRGVVFNAGERVEGYTSLLWVLQLAVGHLIGVSGEIFPHVLSLAYTVGTLIVWGLFIARQPGGGHRGVVIGMVLLALSVNRSWAVWATSGLETRCFTFFVLLMFYVLLRAEQATERRVRRRWLAGVSLTLAVATLARPDAQAFFPLVVAFCLLGRRCAGREVLALTAPFVGVVGAQYLWRHAYYGAWLPNTYYAKVGDPWPEMGVRYLLAFILEYAYYLILSLILFTWRRVESPLSRRLGVLAVACMLVHAGYYCYRVGGDLFEFRIFDFCVPLIAWMAAESVVVLYARHPVWAVAIGTLSLAYSLVIPTSAAINTRIPPDELVKEVFAARDQFKVTPENTAVARWMPGMTPIINLDRQLLATLNTHFIAMRQEHHRACWLNFKKNIELASGVADRGILPPMTVSSANIGVLGYYVDVPVVDLFGLTDAVVARVKSSNTVRLMAHERSAPFAYLEQRHAHVGILSATRYPLPQKTVPPGRVVTLVRKEYSIRIGGGAWLNISSWDPEWVRANFKETPVDLVPLGIEPGPG